MVLSLGIFWVQRGPNGGALGRRAQWTKLSAVFIMFDTHSHRVPVLVIWRKLTRGSGVRLHLSRWGIWSLITSSTALLGSTYISYIFILHSHGISIMVIEWPCSRLEGPDWGFPLESDRSVSSWVTLENSMCSKIESSGQFWITCTRGWVRSWYCSGDAMLHA